MDAPLENWNHAMHSEMCREIDKLTAERDARLSDLVRAQSRIIALETERDNLEIARDIHAKSSASSYQRAYKAETERDTLRAELAQVKAELYAVNLWAHRALYQIAYYVDEFVQITNMSEGVTGWHMNGDILKWEQVECLEPLSDFAYWAKQEYGGLDKQPPEGMTEVLIVKPPAATEPATHAQIVADVAHRDDD